MRSSENWCVCTASWQFALKRRYIGRNPTTGVKHFNERHESRTKRMLTMEGERRVLKRRRRTFGWRLRSESQIQLDTLFPKTISDQKRTRKELRGYLFKAGSMSVRSVSGSKRFCIDTGSTVTITSSVGDTYAARTWPARVVPSGLPTTMCVWTTGFP